MKHQPIMFLLFHCPFSFASFPFVSCHVANFLHMIEAMTNFLNILACIQIIQSILNYSQEGVVWSRHDGRVLHCVCFMSPVKG